MFDRYRDILSVYEVAEALHVSKNHVYELLKNGELHGHREGHVWKITKIALIDYVMKKGGVSYKAFSSYANVTPFTPALPKAAWFN